jgi:hypothetical protein
MRMIGARTRAVAPDRFRKPELSWTPDVNRDATILLGLVVGLAQAVGILAPPVDASAYWLAGTSTDLYPAAWSEVKNGYLFYPPPIAQISTLLQPIGWGAFVTILTTGIFASVWYCAGRWSLLLLAIGVPYLAFGVGPPEAFGFLGYALIGNLQWIIAALTIAALRYPALWSLVLVTKVTTAIGWWWHVLRGEWRAAAIGAVASVAVIGVSFLLAPHLWFEFAEFSLRNATMADPPMAMFPIPLGLRLVTGLVVLVWGARTSRAWTVPFVVGWSLPALYGAGFLPFWVAAWKIRHYRP